MTSDPLDPAPMQPAPPPTGGGARRNPGHVYQCEVCGEPVALTHQEYDDLTEEARRRHTALARKHRPLKWGPRVRCEAHALPPGQPHPSEVKATPVHEPRHMPPLGNTFHLKPTERNDYGATVTIRDVEGNLDTVAGQGRVGEVVASVCAYIDKLNERDPTREWRVLTVSSPGTIYGDLQGARDPMSLRPENIALGRAGRLDLLDTRPPQRLRPDWDGKVRPPSVHVHHRRGHGPVA